MKLVLVLELLSLSFIVRYVCAASDPNPNYRLPDSETSSSSISLRPEEEISNTNPISATTTKDAAANFQRGGEHSPDHHPFDMGESLLELHSQSKGEGEGEGDPCLSDDDKNQAPNSRRGRRLRRQFCSSSYIISPYRTTGGETPVTLPPIPAWGNVDLNIPTNQVTSSDGIREDPKLCADDWQNMPVCAPESSVIGDYLPECRPRIPFCKDGDILFCCGFVALNPWWTVGAGLSRKELINLKYPYYGLQCLSVGGLI